MATRKALIHRYKNKPDILTVEKNCCSDVMSPGSNDFDLLIVLPTAAAKTDIAVVADAISGQYKIRGKHLQKHWPGSPGEKYKFRVDIANVRYTSSERIRQELLRSGQWVGQWTVRNVEVDPEQLLGTASDIDIE